MQESLNSALPHRGITRKIIGVGEDPKNDSEFVVFSFDPLTRTESISGHIAAQKNSAIVQLRGKSFFIATSKRDDSFLVQYTYNELKFDKK